MKLNIYLSITPFYAIIQDFHKYLWYTTLKRNFFAQLIHMTLYNFFSYLSNFLTFNIVYLYKWDIGVCTITKKKKNTAKQEQDKMKNLKK